METSPGMIGGTPSRSCRRSTSCPTSHSKRVTSERSLVAPSLKNTPVRDFSTSSLFEHFFRFNFRGFLSFWSFLSVFPNVRHNSFLPFIICFPLQSQFSSLFFYHLPSFVKVAIVVLETSFLLDNYLSLTLLKDSKSLSFLYTCFSLSLKKSKTKLHERIFFQKQMLYPSRRPLRLSETLKHKR